MNLLDLARAAVPSSATISELARCWRVWYPNAGPTEVIFVPEVTRAEVAEIYPGADVEPLPDTVRNATASEADELSELIKAVLANAGDTDRAEALTVALGDPEAALVSFRALQDSQVLSSNNKALPIATTGTAVTPRRIEIT